MIERRVKIQTLEIIIGGAEASDCVSACIRIVLV